MSHCRWCSRPHHCSFALERAGDYLRFDLHIVGSFADAVVALFIGRDWRSTPLTVPGPKGARAASFDLDLRMQPHGQLMIASNKRIAGSNGRADDLNALKALQDLFPNDTQLHFRQSITHASMNTHTKA